KLDAYWAFQLLFKDCSVKKIIMNYPDPWFKKSHEEKRLTKRENLYIYAKKLIHNGEIRIRTDDYPFVDFTLQECNFLGCFSVNLSTPTIDEPLTKYEKRWLSMGKSICDIVLKKEKEPKPIKIREIGEVKDLFPVRIDMEELNIKEISNKEFKIEEGLYLKCFSVWKRDEDYAVEILLSEQGFLQAFMVTVKKREGYFIMDVSQFSEIFKTEGVKKSLDFLGKILRKES
ncbi:MAG: tRNA (guanine-N7)-methyltransferase, partial [Thermodesulfovibrio sp.]|nr:tRNA (guanine-N7)-methyltransferase [Thermodesulfovibrio sp.]